MSKLRRQLSSNTSNVVEPKKEELPQVNEAVEKIKSEFKRYL